MRPPRNSDSPKFRYGPRVRQQRDLVACHCHRPVSCPSAVGIIFDWMSVEFLHLVRQAQTSFLTTTRKVVIDLQGARCEQGYNGELLFPPVMRGMYL